MLTVCKHCGKYITQGAMCECKVKVNRVVSDEQRESDKFYTKAPWRKVRLKVIKRDGCVCIRCLIKYGLIVTANLQGHHIKSRKHYPELELQESNIICVCQTCNLQLGTTDEVDFIYEIPDEYEIIL